MARSIMQKTKECYLCRKAAAECGYFGELSSKGLHRHHVIFGRGYRSLSEKYGLWVYLCPMHHNEGWESVHKNKRINVDLRREAEKLFLQDHTITEWMEIFTKNYLEQNEINRIMTEQKTTSKTENIENKPVNEDKTLKNRIMTKEPPEGFYFIEEENGDG